MAMRWIGAGAALLALGGCDGDFDFDDPPEDEVLAAAFAEMEDRLSPLPLAGVEEMPVSGSSVFEGFAAIDMETTTPTTLVGTAALVADFGDSTITGSLDGFTGSVDGGAVQTMDGSILVQDGELQVLTPSGFGANVGGVLTGGGEVVGVDGSVFGNFRSSDGVTADALTAESASGTDFTLNGQGVEGNLTIVAEH